MRRIFSYIWCFLQYLNSNIKFYTLYVYSLISSICKQCNIIKYRYLNILSVFINRYSNYFNKKAIKKKRARFRRVIYIMNMYKRLKFRIAFSIRLNNCIKIFISRTFSILPVLIKVIISLVNYFYWLIIMFFSRTYVLYYFILAIPSVFVFSSVCKIIYKLIDCGLKFYIILISGDTPFQKKMIFTHNIYLLFVNKKNKLRWEGIHKKFIIYTRYFNINFLLRIEEFASNYERMFLRLLTKIDWTWHLQIIFCKYICKSLYILTILFVCSVIIILLYYYIKFIFFLILLLYQLWLIFFSMLLVYFIIKYPFAKVNYMLFVEIFTRILSFNYIRKIWNEGIGKKILRVCSFFFLINVICFCIRLFFYWGLYLIKYYYIFLYNRSKLSKRKRYFYIIMKIMKIKKFEEYLDKVIYFTKADVVTPILSNLRPKLIKIIKIQLNNINIRKKIKKIVKISDKIEEYIAETIYITFTNTVWKVRRIYWGWEYKKLTIILKMEAKAKKFGVKMFNIPGYIDAICLRLYEYYLTLCAKWNWLNTELGMAIKLNVELLKIKKNNYIKLKKYQVWFNFVLIKKVLTDMFINRIKKQRYRLLYYMPKLYNNIKCFIVYLWVGIKIFMRLAIKSIKMFMLLVTKMILFFVNIKYNIKKLNVRIWSLNGYIKHILPKMSKLIYEHTKKKYKEKRLFKTNKILVWKIFVNIKSSIINKIINKNMYVLNMREICVSKYLKLKEYIYSFFIKR